MNYTYNDYINDNSETVLFKKKEKPQKKEKPFYTYNDFIKDENEIDLDPADDLISNDLANDYKMGIDKNGNNLALLSIAYILSFILAIFFLFIGNFIAFFVTFMINLMKHY